MRNDAVMARALDNNWKHSAPRQITELGAGDGNFLLSVAQRILRRWSDVKITLLDRQANVSVETLGAFANLGWQAEAIVTDVFAWPQTAGDIVVANLFLHHFEDAQLTELLHLVSLRAKLFIAVEPRRASWPLLCSRLLGAIGCNDVTRHDAVVSVRAGFSGSELSWLWPDKNNWQLTEQSAGPFSHLFMARKTS